MFSAVYVDRNGDEHFLGSVKIGKKNIKDSEKNSISNKFETIDFLPIQFDSLSSTFFSLGQSDNYYEIIKSFGDDTRNNILIALNDIAYNEDIFETVKDLGITRTSILRSVSSTTVKGQYRRIAHGGARLTEYDFSYFSPNNKKVTSYELNFKVIPESNPPSNIHVIIGRNGVGKTHLIRNMIQSLIYNNDDQYGYFEVDAWNDTTFANVVCVAFSAFDEFPTSSKETKIPYLFVGLEQDYIKKDDNTKSQIKSRIDILRDQFEKSLTNCFASQSKRDRWLNAVNILEADPIFHESDIRSIDIVKNPKLESSANAGRIFNKLSSGHKIILLTITQLVEKVEESTLVLLDEPETHLHPPLLSAFIRALSDLLIDRNGVAIITTHSPVVLQEVPQNCVWKLWRSDSIMKAQRLEVETFGENVGSLINEVFGLEVTYSGFHRILSESVSKYSANYDRIIQKFDNKLGNEARAILKMLIADYEEEED
jgi:predicted ATPase